jgi:hypothetical protein
VAVTRVLRRVGIVRGDPGLVQYVQRVAGSDERAVVYLDLPAYRELSQPRRVRVTIEEEP